MTFKEWFEETFSAKRIVTSITFSVIVFVTYWAITIYEKAADNVLLTFGAIFIVILVMLLFGGSFLDAMSKD